MTALRGEPLVEVTRDGMVESVHCVAACAMDDAGNELLAIGSVEAPVFLRSTAKPFIASAIVASGAAERFAFDDREIAIIAASHSAQPFHISAVRSILSKIGMGEAALQCGPEGEGYPPEPIYNNCSGKHAGILALCTTIGSDPQTYRDPENPAQRVILDVCARMSGVRRDELHVGVDGCGVPVYAVPLRAAAQSYMRFACGEGLDLRHSRALRRVRDAMIANPEFVSGSGEFDAELMRAGAGALACKGGAEGVHGIALIEQRAGVVLKIADGNSRARPPAAMAVLAMLHALPQGHLDGLAAFARPAVHNKSGLQVGEIRGVVA